MCNTPDKLGMRKVGHLMPKAPMLQMKSSVTKTVTSYLTGVQSRGLKGKKHLSHHSTYKLAKKGIPDCRCRKVLMKF